MICPPGLALNQGQSGRLMVTNHSKRQSRAAGSFIGPLAVMPQCESP
jgi:hypothetical protein